MRNVPLRKLLFLVATLSPMPAVAQASAAGSGRAQLALSARLVVPYQMKVRQVAPTSVVASGRGGTEFEVRLVTASNAEWTLAMSPVATAATAKNAASSLEVLEVLDENGEWRALSEAIPSAVILARGSATDRTPVSVRLRTRGRSVADLSRLRFVLTPSEGALRAR